MSEKIKPVPGSTDVSVASDGMRARALAAELGETLNRHRADPADGIAALLIAFGTAMCQAVQVPSAKEGREANRTVFLGMIEDLRRDLMNVDLSDKASEELLGRMKAEMFRRRMVSGGSGKEVLH